jgi:hypothetical protein
MEQWVEDFCNDPSLRQRFLRTPKMSDEPRHPTKELILPGTGKVVQIDEKLLSGIQRLNDLGFTTQFCCQGGGPGYNIAYIVLEAGKNFPPELLQAWQGAGFDVNPSRVYAGRLAAPMPVLTDHFCLSSDGSRRKRSGTRFPPELLNAWHCTGGCKAPASEVHSSLQHGQEQEPADGFCRSLDDWVQGKLDLSGASYRVVSALRTGFPPGKPGEPKRGEDSRHG